MIIDLHLKDKLVIVVGGGNESEKRVKSLIPQGCKIVVLSDKINPQLRNFEKKGKIKIKRLKVFDVKFLHSYKPFLVISTTPDSKLNMKIVKEAKKMKIITYSSDNPKISDFSHLSLLKIDNFVKVAISTGGASPTIAKKIKSKAELALKNIVDKEDGYQIQLQKMARSVAKDKITSQPARKKFLYSVLNDPKIKQLIKERRIKIAERRVMSMVRGSD